MAVRIRLNSRGIAEMLNANDTREGLTPIAEQVLSNSRATAPVVSGAYQGSLRIEQDTTDRVAIRVVADVPYAMSVEADYGTLARALQ